METKQRHGCLAAWLVLIIVTNAFMAFIYLLSGGARELTGMSGSMFVLLLLLGVFNIVCAIALLNWKKWGFFGFAASAAVSLLVNLSAGIGGVAVLGLVGVAILYGVLQMGGERNAWSQLD